MRSRAGQKAFTLRSVPGTLLPQPSQPFLAIADGFSLHAGVAACADERKKVERLCRYIARPAIAEIYTHVAIHKLKEIHTATHPARLPPALAADRAAGHARQTVEAALAGGRRAD